MKEVPAHTQRWCPGIDDVTAAEYAQNLEANLSDLLERNHVRPLSSSDHSESYLGTLLSIAAENSSTIVLPPPMDLGEFARAGTQEGVSRTVADPQNVKSRRGK